MASMCHDKPKATENANMIEGTQGEKRCIVSDPLITAGLVHRSYRETALSGMCSSRTGCVTLSRTFHLEYLAHGLFVGVNAIVHACSVLTCFQLMEVIPTQGSFSTCETNSEIECLNYLVTNTAAMNLEHRFRMLDMNCNSTDHVYCRSTHTSTSISPSGPVNTPRIRFTASFLLLSASRWRALVTGEPYPLLRCLRL